MLLCIDCQRGVSILAILLTRAKNCCGSQCIDAWTVILCPIANIAKESSANETAHLKVSAPHVLISITYEVQRWVGTHIHNFQL